MLLKSGCGLAGAISLLLTLSGERIYAIGGRPDLGISLLYVARALGTGIGPLLSRRITGELSSRMRPLLGIAFVWGALWYALFAIVHHPALTFICVVIAHFGGSIVWVDSTVLLQRMVPDEFRGRVFAADMAMVTLMIATSTWIYGELAALGIDLRLLAGAVTGSLLVPAALWTVAGRRLWGREGRG